MSLLAESRHRPGLAQRLSATAHIRTRRAPGARFADLSAGRRCLTRIIWTNGGQNRSWSAEYFLHSPPQWEPQQLFQPILKRALAYCPQRLVGVAIDDTRLRKTGRVIPQAFYQRDPLSPPFHLNLMLGLRFLQASLLVPVHRKAPVGTRALPIRFREVSRIKRPGRKATEEMRKQYREAVKQKNLSRSFVDMGKETQAGTGRRRAGVTRCWFWLATAVSVIAPALARFRKDRFWLVRTRKDARL